MPFPSSPPIDTRNTRWSLIRELTAGASPADSRTQFYELCVRYWPPIQQHIRHCGYDEVASRALSNEFFAYLQSEALARVGRHSRFREFLQHELDAFLVRKRAGGIVATAPGVEQAAPSSEALRQSFALEVIGHSMARLRAEAVEADRAQMFELLERYLSSEAKPDDIENAAKALGAKPLFVTMAIRRLRQRFRLLVDDELARLVTDEVELAEERAAMLGALARA